MQDLQFSGATGTYNRNSSKLDQLADGFSLPTSPVWAGFVSATGNESPSCAASQKSHSAKRKPTQRLNMAFQTLSSSSRVLCCAVLCYAHLCTQRTVICWRRLRCILSTSSASYCCNCLSTESFKHCCSIDPWLSQNVTDCACARLATTSDCVAFTCDSWLNVLSFILLFRHAFVTVTGNPFTFHTVASCETSATVCCLWAAWCDEFSNPNE